MGWSNNFCSVVPFLSTLFFKKVKVNKYLGYKKIKNNNNWSDFSQRFLVQVVDVLVWLLLQLTEKNMHTQ